jgi:hypothetical protein
MAGSRGRGGGQETGQVIRDLTGERRMMAFAASEFRERPRFFLFFLFSFWLWLPRTRASFRRRAAFVCSPQLNSSPSWARSIGLSVASSFQPSQPASTTACLPLLEPAGSHWASATSIVDRIRHRHCNMHTIHSDQALRRIVIIIHHASSVQWRIITNQTWHAHNTSHSLSKQGSAARI